MKKQTFEEALEWLRELRNKTLIPPSDDTPRYYLRGTTHVPLSEEEWRAYYGKRLSLTEEQWDKLLEVVHEHELPCRLLSTQFGFSFGLYVHEHDENQEPTNLILSVDYAQMPGHVKDVNSTRFQQLAAQQLMDDVTHTPRNTELLRWYGFDPLPERASHYVY